MATSLPVVSLIRTRLGAAGLIVVLNDDVPTCATIEVTPAATAALRGIAAAGALAEDVN